MSARRTTGLLHKLKWYAETYGLPLQTVINARNRDWPLDDPHKLLEKLIHAPGPKSNVQTLIDYVNGKATPRPRVKSASPTGKSRVTLTVGDMLFTRYVTADEANAIVQLIGEGAWDVEG